MILTAFYRNDQPDGYAVQIGPIERPEWESLLRSCDSIIKSDADPKAAIMEMIVHYAGSQSNEGRTTFAACVEIATANGWIPDDEFNGVLQMHTTPQIEMLLMQNAKP